MARTKQQIIGAFFDAYQRRDWSALQQVVADDVQWTFPGRNPLSGTYTGAMEVVGFFDRMGALMGASNIQVERLVTGEADDYVLECQHIRTNRPDGIQLNHQWCVLWRFQGEKLSRGKHFAEQQHDADEFFNQVLN